VEHSVDLVPVLRRNGLVLSEAQCDLLEKYVELLMEWNQKVNLISRKDEDNVWAGHILHSLSPLLRVDLPERAQVLDLGSGGGLPGVPLAILCEGWSVVLLDSIQKKCAAVEDIILRLGLSERIHVVCGRAEEKGIVQKMGKTFDLVLARGVAPLVDLVRWSRPYLKNGGSGSVKEAVGGRYSVASPVLLAYKGGDLEAEIRAMQIKTQTGVAASVPLVFDGSEEMGLLEKKLIIIAP